MSWPERGNDAVMKDNVTAFTAQIVGHRIVKAEQKSVAHKWYGSTTGLVLTLDTGKQVQLINTSDCCAYTELNHFLMNADRIDHVITSVTTDDEFGTWHIYTGLQEFMSLDVSWSEGNGYYGYGFDIQVVDA